MSNYDGLDNVELEVARCAVRSFTRRPHMGNWLLSSISARSQCWHDGVCEATCLKRQMDWRWALITDADLDRFENDPKHSAPDPGCTCGIYGCLTLGDLVHQYAMQCREIVTVIAAEGRTMIGDIGLRTARARVVAFWTDRPLVQALAIRQFPDAVGYTDIHPMLEDYRIPIQGTRKIVFDGVAFSDEHPAWWDEIVTTKPPENVDISRMVFHSWYNMPTSYSFSVSSGIVSTTGEEEEVDTRTPQQKVLDEKKKPRTYPTSIRLPGIRRKIRE